MAKLMYRTCSFLKTTWSFTGQEFRHQRWTAAFAETRDLCCSVPEAQQCRHSDTTSASFANLDDETHHREIKQAHQWQTSAIRFSSWLKRIKFLQAYKHDYQPSQSLLNVSVYQIQVHTIQIKSICTLCGLFLFSTATLHQQNRDYGLVLGRHHN